MFTSSNVGNWGYTFITLGACIELVAIVNLVCLIEYPLKKGIVIREKANIFNPTEVDTNNFIDENNNNSETAD